jgi:hypothetical protein
MRIDVGRWRRAAVPGAASGDPIMASPVSDSATLAELGVSKKRAADSLQSVFGIFASTRKSDVYPSS